MGREDVSWAAGVGNSQEVSTFLLCAALRSPLLAHLPLAFHFVPATPFQAFFFPLDRWGD